MTLVTKLLNITVLFSSLQNVNYTCTGRLFRQICDTLPINSFQVSVASRVILVCTDTNID